MQKQQEIRSSSRVVRSGEVEYCSIAGNLMDSWFNLYMCIHLFWLLLLVFFSPIFLIIHLLISFELQSHHLLQKVRKQFPLNMHPLLHQLDSLYAPGRIGMLSSFMVLFVTYGLRCLAIVFLSVVFKLNCGVFCLIICQLKPLSFHVKKGISLMFLEKSDPILLLLVSLCSA